MEKAAKRKVVVRPIGEKGETRALPALPLPPFVTQEIDLLPLESFYRATLGVPRYVVIVTQGDILTTLEAFLIAFPLGEKRTFICASTDEDLLRRLYSGLPQVDTTFLFLARRPEEFWSVLAFFALQDRKRVLVGEPHGIFAECAWEYFVPFLPVDIPCFSFWQRSAFLYLPLSLCGVLPEEVERGFQEGYALLREVALRMALIISRELERKDCIYFVVDSLLLKKVTMSFAPLLEECLGRKELLRIAGNGDFFREREEMPRSLVLFIRGNTRQGFQVKIPQTFSSLSGSFTPPGSLRRCSFADVQNAEAEVLQSLLRHVGGRFFVVEIPELSPFFVGQYMAFLQYLACYSAWLRGVDVFSDPPLVQFERSIISFLARRGEEEAR